MPMACPVGAMQLLLLFTAAAAGAAGAAAAAMPRSSILHVVRVQTSTMSTSLRTLQLTHITGPCTVNRVHQLSDCSHQLAPASAVTMRLNAHCYNILVCSSIKTRASHTCRGQEHHESAKHAQLHTKQLLVASRKGSSRIRN